MATESKLGALALMRKQYSEGGPHEYIEREEGPRIQYPVINHDPVFQAKEKHENLKSVYAAKLKDPRWHNKRLQILERDNYTCTCCRNKELTLHVHHKQYIGENPWDTPNQFLVTLCEVCHSIEHTRLSPLEKYLLNVIRLSESDTHTLIRVHSTVFNLKNSKTKNIL